jgi:hypothetical protein
MMTVSLRADLSGLETGLRRAQELLARSAEGLALQERRFRQAGAAAQDYADGATRGLAGTTDAVGALGRSAANLERYWGGAWEAMDATADAALGRMTHRFGRALAAMMVDGRGLQDFWRGLWRDLVEIAVQRLLQIVVDTRGAVSAMRDALSLAGGGLLGGVGGLLGGIFGGVGKVLGTIGSWLGFDNPVHDAWARKQGFDFAKHFRAGVSAAMALRTNAPATLSPALAGAGLGSMRAANFRAVSIQPGAFVVNVSAQKLDERAIRDAGGILADEVNRRLGWTDRRSGV